MDTYVRDRPAVRQVLSQRQVRRTLLRATTPPRAAASPRGEDAFVRTRSDKPCCVHRLGLVATSPLRATLPKATSASSFYRKRQATRRLHFSERQALRLQLGPTRQAPRTKAMRSRERQPIPGGPKRFATVATSLTYSSSCDRRPDHDRSRCDRLLAPSANPLHRDKRRDHPRSALVCDYRTPANSPGRDYRYPINSTGRDNRFVPGSVRCD